MTSHELAKKLLEMPDVKVAIPNLFSDGSGMFYENIVGPMKPERLQMSSGKPFEDLIVLVPE